MEELPQYLMDIIKKGECSTTEFKEAKKGLPSTLFETICGMLNRLGGHIFLGVNDNGSIIGINPDLKDEMKKQFTNMLNQEAKLSPQIGLDIVEYKYKDKIVLYIYVPEGNVVYRTCGKVFDRRLEGDYYIKDGSQSITRLNIFKAIPTFEEFVYTDVKRSDLRDDLIDKARTMAVKENKNHPWKDMTNDEILTSCNMFGTDPDGNPGITVAAILLFGTDNIIFAKVPWYKTDCILRIEDLDRYDDKDRVATNLIDSYDRIYAFLEKHLNDKFYLEEVDGVLVRRSIRSIIAREVTVNTLMHRDYSGLEYAQVIVTKDFLTAKNPNITRLMNYVDITDYTPFTKNPRIAKVFEAIGYADEMGTGIKKLTRYTREYSGKQPIFIDAEMFETRIPLRRDGIKEEKIVFEDDLTFNEKLVMEYILEHKMVTREEVSKYIKKGKTVTVELLNKLIDKDMIIWTGTSKNDEHGRYIMK